MGSIHARYGSFNPALDIYYHLVNICQRTPYSGYIQPMNVTLKSELDFRSRSRLVLISFETFESWDDDREIPCMHSPFQINGFDFTNVTRLHMHWRSERFSKYASGFEEIYECYTRRSNGDWTKMVSFETADASAIKRGIPLLNKATYDVLIAECQDMPMAPHVYSEMQRLLKCLTDDRNYWVSGANVARALTDGLELESNGLQWARDNHITAQNINGEYHKTI